MDPPLPNVDVYPVDCGEVLCTAGSTSSRILSNPVSNRVSNPDPDTPCPVEIFIGTCPPPLLPLPLQEEGYVMPLSKTPCAAQTRDAGVGPGAENVSDHFADEYAAAFHYFPSRADYEAKSRENPVFGRRESGFCQSGLTNLL